MSVCVFCKPYKRFLWDEWDEIAETKILPQKLSRETKQYNTQRDKHKQYAQEFGDLESRRERERELFAV